MRLSSLIASLTICCFSLTTQAQLKTPAPSPLQVVKQDFGLSYIELSYSRPGVKGRQVFGDLEPYGEIWRTGANGATTLTFGSDVTIGGKLIPAGKYGLLTIPGSTEWTVIITKQTNVTADATVYKESEDMVRLHIAPRQLPFSMETFSILFNNITPSSLDIDLLWGETMVSFPVTTDVDTKVMADIKTAMEAEGNKPYFQAAAYYLASGKDLNQALTWFDKAVEQNPNAFWVWYQKASCEAKLGKKEAAATSAKKSIELAEKAHNPDYVALNKKLLATLK